MNLVSTADKIVFSSLKNLNHGYIELTNYDGRQYKLGDPKSILKASLIIKKPGVTLSILNRGSIGLAESYMREEFETDKELWKPLQFFSSFASVALNDTIRSIASSLIKDFLYLICLGFFCLF